MLKRQMESHTSRSILAVGEPRRCCAESDPVGSDGSRQACLGMHQARHNWHSQHESRWDLTACVVAAAAVEQATGRN